MLEIKVVRDLLLPERTSSVVKLYKDGIWMTDNNGLPYLFYTVEDTVREEPCHPVITPGPKIAGRTAIPYGCYKLGIRDVGGFHARYNKRFPDIHKGMIELLDVPGFKYILFHIGNDEKDSRGCLCVGSFRTSNGKVFQSSIAYKRFYSAVVEDVAAGTARVDISAALEPTEE